MPFELDSVINIINEVRRYDSEKPWIEFKVNNSNPQEIGEYISALSNTAALYRQNYGFIIWGINNDTHKIDGTNFNPQKTKKGNQSLELWLSTLIEPRIPFFFHTVEIEGKTVVLMEIEAAHSSPIRFHGVEYIRIGSNKTNLRNYPDTEQKLWNIFSRIPYDMITAAENLSVEAVLNMLDYQRCFEMLSIELPDNNNLVIERLLSEKMIVKNEAEKYDITNYGALLYARKLSDFSDLERKAIRVIRYYGNERISSTSTEIFNDIGYANSFYTLLDYIMSVVPLNETFESGIRKTSPMFPEEAVRELLGNIIIHQDLLMRGSWTTVEIFDSRIEFTNPGPPLIEKIRFLDFPPASRNEKIAGFLRRVGVCEEKGSGYDKIVFQTELHNLPPPEIMVYDTHTKVTLFAHKPFSKMRINERQLACYLHACLKFIRNEDMTNATLRERFAIDAKNSSMISRLLNDTCDTGLIKEPENNAKGKHRRFLPYWA